MLVGLTALCTWSPTRTKFMGSASTYLPTIKWNIAHSLSSAVRILLWKTRRFGSSFGITTMKWRYVCMSWHSRVYIMYMFMYACYVWHCNYVVDIFTWCIKCGIVHLYAAGIEGRSISYCHAINFLGGIVYSTVDLLALHNNVYYRGMHNPFSIFSMCIKILFL